MRSPLNVGTLEHNLACYPWRSRDLLFLVLRTGETIEVIFNCSGEGAGEERQVDNVVGRLDNDRGDCNQDTILYYYVPLASRTHSYGENGNLCLPPFIMSSIHWLVDCQKVLECPHSC